MSDTSTSMGEEGPTVYHDALAEGMRLRMLRFLANEPSDAPPGIPWYHVIVEVRHGKRKPSEAEVRELLAPHMEEGKPYELDLFWVIPEIRYEGERGHREFNPYHEGELGADNSRFLYNCVADFAILPPNTPRPSWCHENTRIVYWK